MGYQTKEIISVCVPSDLDAVGGTVKKSWDTLMGNQAVSKFWRDVELSSTAIYISLALGLVYTMMYLYAMSNFAHIIAYIAIVMIEIIFIGGMGAALYGTTKVNPATGMWITFGCTLFAFLLFNCLMYCSWSKMKVAIAVIDSAADFMTATKRMAFVTIFYFFVGVIVFVIWGVGAIGVVAINEIDVQTNADGEYEKQIHFTNGSIAMLCIMGFGLIWIQNFIREKTKFIYMISASQYYFTSSRDKEGSASVMAGIMISYFKHAGSIALGSLLHTIVTVIRIIVDALVDASERKNGSNGIVVLVGCLLKCCVRWLEGMIEWINTVAYAFMAISGDPYCTSAWSGFILNLKHLTKFYFAKMLAGMFVFIGMLAVVALNTGTCFLIMKYATKDTNEISSVWIPLVIIIIATLITAELFIGMFKEAVIATLMCLAVDIELNGECKFGSPSFHEKMDKIMEKDGHHAQDPELDIAQNIRGVHGKQNGNQVYQAVNTTGDQQVAYQQPPQGYTGTYNNGGNNN